MPDVKRPEGRLPRAAIIVHPGKVDRGSLRMAVEAAELRHHWHPSTWYETTLEQLGDVLARQALEHHPDLVVAAGGDGTVRAVVDALEGTDVPLGIVPGGTGNLLARNLGIDVVSLRVAVDTAFGGDEARIDVGHATAERRDGSRDNFLFTVLAGIGIDAGMIANTPNELKRRVGWLAYITGIYRTIVSGAHFTARMRVEQGQAHSVHAQSIMVGNCGLMPGGFLLLPDAEIDDGLLDVCVLRPRGLFGWLKIWFRMSWQTLVTRSHRRTGRKLLAEAREIRALRYEQGSSVVFRLTSGPEEFEIDGEAVGKVVAAYVTVRASALTVRIPSEGGMSQQRLRFEEAMSLGRLQRRRVRDRVDEVRERVGVVGGRVREAARSLAGAGRADDAK